MSEALPPWRRVLYDVTSPYPDNYVPPDFLCQNQVSAAPVIPLHALIFHSLVITQRLSLLAFALTAFMHLYDDTISTAAMTAVNAIAVVTAFILYFATTKTSAPLRTATTAIIRFALFVLLIVLTSPLISTLTVEYATDTIVTLSIVLTGVHLILPSTAPVIPIGISGETTISLCSATTVATMLASRLPNTGVFGAAAPITWMIYAATLIAIQPVALSIIERLPPPRQVLITIILVIVAISVLAHCSISMMFVYIIAVVCCSGIGPLLFYWKQFHQIVYRGAWDYDETAELMQADNL